jgi:c-di-GMP-binding flagellar brake protein YcgR
MPTLQALANRQIVDALTTAASRQIPISASVQIDGVWLNLRSRMLAVRDGLVWIEQPCGDHGPQEFSPGDHVAVNFKLRHHKHIFDTEVSALAAGEGGMAALGLKWPARMQRLQRRAFLRADVPAGRIVRASFWLGGHDAEPAGADHASPVWSGKVSNISAGGLQMVAPEACALEEGDVVGVRVSFGPTTGESVYADAQVRHIEAAGGATTIGLQFVGLGHTPQGESALQIISAKVNDYQRMAELAHRRTAEQSDGE